MKWIGNTIVFLTSPTPSDCKNVIHQISIDRKPCEKITLNSSSTDSTIILLSQLHQTNVKRLEIKETKLTIEAIHYLSRLTSNDQLKYLLLDDITLSTNGGLNSLTNALSTNTSLRHLWLWRVRLTEDDMVNISQAITINTTLYGLSLINCSITNDGLVQLSNGLTHNKTMNYLVICSNRLITSTTTVCDIIHNSPLTSLNLSGTSLPLTVSHNYCMLYQLTASSKN